MAEELGYLLTVISSGIVVGEMKNQDLQFNDERNSSHKCLIVKDTVGFYCPGANQKSVPCPKGTFNPTEGATSVESCLKCPAEEGQDTCLCLREGQVFQPSDGQCPCAPGYKMAEEETKCLQQVYDICRDGTTRNQEGVCLTKNEWNEYCSSKTIIPVDKIRKVIKSRQFFLTDQCIQQKAVFYPLYLVETNGQGFWGIYNPDQELFQNLFMKNVNPFLNINASVRSTDNTSSEGEFGFDNSSFYWYFKKLLHESLLTGTVFSGILNPIACINIGDIIVFFVSNEHYPVYDIDNLYNTNNLFDWGGFRALAEELSLTSSIPCFLFFQFSQPGVYVLRLSSNRHKRMYIKVMPFGGQCYEEGPFFPTTPRHFIRAGIARIPNLLLRPDWIAIFSLIIGAVVIFGICMTLLFLFKEFGWTEKTLMTPKFHKLQLNYNLDDYSSKGLSISAVKKYHHRVQRATHCGGSQGNENREEASALRHDEFWDYDQQIDLESFSINNFYDILLKQTHSVVARLSQQKDEVKILYQKIEKESDFLRELWATRMNAKIQKPVSKTVMEAYMKKTQEIEVETERRKKLGAEYEQVLRKQQQLLLEDWSYHEEHHVLFSTALREAMRLLEDLSENLAHHEIRTMLSDKDHQLVVDRLGALIIQISSAVAKECHRLKTWGVLGEGTGANLVCKEKSEVLSREELIAELCTTEVPLIPYVPHPTCTSTSLPVKTKLKSFLSNKDIKYGGSINDPETGMLVPILAVTIHPQTGLVYPLGGTYISPLTKMVTPIEIGEPMIESKTGKTVPILGVSIDPNTGNVIPVGGLLSPSNNPIILGDSFLEPLSGKTARVRGASLQGSKVVPYAGGYQALLSAYMLTCQIQVIEALKEYNNSLTIGLSASNTLNKKHVLKAVVEEMKAAIRRDLHHMIHTIYEMDQQLHMATTLTSKGGSLGIITYPGTDLSIPAVAGVEIPDPGGSDLMVPILGVEHDRSTGNLIPLAGTMEDANGKGLAPITTGARTIDPVTGEICSVVGAHIDPWTNTIVPHTQSFVETSEGKSNLGMVGLEILEIEVSSKHRYWDCQRGKEELLFRDIHSLLQYVINSAQKSRIEKTQYEEKLAILEETCHSIQESCQREAQRRTPMDMDIVNLLPPNLVQMIAKGDKEEMEQQLTFVASFRKLMEKILQFIEKINQQEDRRRTQLQRLQKEAEEVAKRKHKKVKRLSLLHEDISVTMHILREFWEHMLNRQTSVDNAYSRLEYRRDLLEIYSVEAKYQVIRPRTIGKSSRVRDVINEKMIPLMKNLIHLLEEKNHITLSPETLRLVSDQHVEQNLHPNRYDSESSPQVLTTSVPADNGYYSRCAINITSADHSESLRPTKHQPKAPIEKTFSMLPITLTASKQHIPREALTRILMEKHASEVVHLELLLLDEEITSIYKVYNEIEQVKEIGIKQIHELKQELQHNWSKAQPQPEELPEGKGKVHERQNQQKQKIFQDLNAVLNELAKQHRNIKQTLHIKHVVEVKDTGLDPKQVVPNFLRTEKEILNDFTLMAADLIEVFSHIKHSVTDEANEKYVSLIMLGNFGGVQVLFTAIGAKAELYPHIVAAIIYCNYMGI
nr:PREDICTED: uncharacterized protein LOC102352720 [Latimeria chalumnae]|eukprot:XP_014345397.1 PREDICTED: uncharacterized protein LOC102352720 [Latimeria chalumnae]